MLAGLEGLEPPTPGFGIQCSSQLELQTLLFLSIFFALYVVYAPCKIYRIFSIPSVLPASPSYLSYNSCCYTLYMLMLYSSPLHLILLFYYSIILVTTPAPTVFPPSLIANLNSLSIAIGVINSICKLALSPGITISAPPNNVATPVTSVVLK